MTPEPVIDGLTDLELVAPRPLTVSSVRSRIVLRAGDRPFVAAGETVEPGTVLAEHVRDAHLEDVLGPLPGATPGGWWRGEVPQGSLGLRRRALEAEGELLFDADNRWRIATGAHREPVESTVAGIVLDVRAGVELVLQVNGRAVPAAEVLGGASRGRLSIVAGPDGEVRAGSIDVGAAGSILVVGSRVDAETLTRARAMGVRGVVVAGLTGKERRDFLASEARQRASLHPRPPFSVLVLEGYSRRPIASPVMALLEGLVDREVGIIVDPPALVFDDPSVRVALPPRGFVRVRAGALAGQEGTWVGRAGLRRFAAGVHLEAGVVRLGEADRAVLPLADLERFV